MRPAAPTAAVVQAAASVDSERASTRDSRRTRNGPGIDREGDCGQHASITRLAPEIGLQFRGQYLGNVEPCTRLGFTRDSAPAMRNGAGPYRTPSAQCDRDCPVTDACKNVLCGVHDKSGDDQAEGIADSLWESTRFDVEQTVDAARAQILRLEGSAESKEISTDVCVDAGAARDGCRKDPH